MTKLWELGNVPIKLQTGKVPRTFFCAQCNKRHNVNDNWHYWNPLFHRRRN